MKIKASYIFNILALVIVALSIFIYIEFNKTKKSIAKTYNNESVEYVNQFAQNIGEMILKNIDEDIYDHLKNNNTLSLKLEEYLQLFITNRYKYIYLLDRESFSTNEYRFLIDGSKNIEEKSEFGELYTPLEIEKFNSLYESKESTFFTHDGVESLWMTFLYPIVINDKVEAILVVDFSMKDYEQILDSLEYFNNTFTKVILFFIAIFFIIVWFSSMDRRREKEKKQAFYNLKLKSEELREESKKVHKLNSTLEVRVKEELEKNRVKDKQMLEQSRLAQMGEMLSMIAHQWRQPLAAIGSTSASLELKATLGKNDKDTVIKLSSKISEYAQHLSQTIDDFRDFFKTNKKEVESSYCEMIDSILNIVEVSIRNQNIKIIKELNSPERFTTFPNEVKQVILNLMKNAEDIILEKKIEDAYIKITTYMDGTLHILEISDNAGGVPEDIICKIFDPYFSTKLEKNGTGLGLYMSKSIIEEHCSGRLSLSNSDVGAVFKIELK